MVPKISKWKIAFYIIGSLIGIIGVVFILELAGLGFMKFFEPKKENIRREIFENTKSYSHGKMQDLAKQALSEAQRQIGMPNIVNFQQRKLLKGILELCDKEKLICFAYLKSDYTGKLIFIGKCIGYGIPFSAQFTNPDKVKTVDGGQYRARNPYTLPQADPNGLFMPTSSSATWLIMIDPKTSKPRAVYIEPEIVVSPFPLHK